MIYAATARCSCGAGLAYDKTCTQEPFNGPSYWACSAVLLGANPAGHVEPYPFAFYEIKAEGQPSARGATTRPLEPVAKPKWLKRFFGPSPD